MNDTKNKPTAEVVNEGTARTILTKDRDSLAEAVSMYEAASNTLRDLIVSTRPKGLLTVDEMGEAVGRDRNYIDSVWSAHGETVKGKQTRVPVTAEANPEAARCVWDALAEAAANVQRTAHMVETTRAARDRTVAMVYASKVLGPTAIASAVGIDRNHVLRIARRAGVPPMHRRNSRNQYTQQAS